MIYDAIVIGSGFGGALAAHPLVHAGWRVLMLERGDWVQRGPACWSAQGVRDLTPHYDRSTPYEVRGEERAQLGGVHCVGGASVFYGGVSLRLREGDFRPTAEERAVRAEWPFGYDQLEPYYAAAERIIGVAGAVGMDPTEPWRSCDYPQRLPPLSRTACRLSDAADRLGYRPFRLPLAINYSDLPGRNRCIGCHTCDCYACAISAKNDVASAVLPELLAHGLPMAANTAAVRILNDGVRATGVQCVDTRTGKRATYAARHVIVAAGALATPHLLLASGLQHHNPAGALVGRMLMRHCNSIVFGVFPRPLDAAREFHKQVGINDLYQHGTIQQIHGPPVGLVRSQLPRLLARLGERMIDRMTGLIVIARDDPQATNRVTLARSLNALGMPCARVEHRYSERDRAARRTLARAAARILRAAGALATFTLPVRTFSHGLGSVRIGSAAESGPLDRNHRFRGLDNLFVTDGSALPTAGSVNPSLTIAALAYRAGCLLAGSAPSQTSRLVREHRITIIPELIHG